MRWSSANASRKGRIIQTSESWFFLAWHMWHPRFIDLLHCLISVSLFAELMLY